MGTLLKIALKRITTKNIISQNRELIHIFMEELKTLPIQEGGEMVKEFFSTTPSAIIPYDEYIHYSDFEKIVLWFKHLIKFESIDDRLVEYEYWKYNREAYGFSSLLSSPTTQLTFAEFCDVFKKDNCIFIKDIGELQIDVSFGRTPEFFLKVLGCYMNQVDLRDIKFKYLESLEYLFPFMDHERSLEYLESKVFEIDFFKNNLKQYSIYEIGKVEFKKSYKEVVKI